ncbi:MAG: GNAT family N-acetyltransferase, partial [Spirochaeta sp.]
ILPMVDRELRCLAREEHTSLILIRDIRVHERRDFLPLHRLGYRIVPNLTNAFLRITQSTFEQYLNDLTTKRRRAVNSHLKQFHSQGCSIERIDDFAPLASAMVELWNNTAARATEYQREQMNEAFFQQMSDRLGDRSFALVCRRNTVPIGFVVLLDAGDCLVSTYCGMDYRYNRSTSTYFVMFYESIRLAIQMRKEWLELGITNYTPKIELGALPEPLRMFVTATHPLSRLLLAPFLRLTGSTPRFSLRHIYKQSYYDRHRFPEPPTAYAFGINYQIQSADIRTLHMKGRAAPPVKRFTLYIHDNFHYPFLLRVRLAHAVPACEDDTAVTCTVVDHSSLHLFLWDRFHRRLSTKDTL